MSYQCGTRSRVALTHISSSSSHIKLVICRTSHTSHVTHISLDSLHTHVLAHTHTRRIVSHTRHTQKGMRHVPRRDNLQVLTHMHITLRFYTSLCASIHHFVLLNITLCFYTSLCASTLLMVHGDVSCVCALCMCIVTCGVYLMCMCLVHVHYDVCCLSANPLGAWCFEIEGTRHAACVTCHLFAT